MKNLFFVTLLCAVAGCSTTTPVSQPTSQPGATSPNSVSYRSASTLPFVEENSKSFLRTGRPQSEREAAHDASESGDPWKLVQPHELVTLGKFRLRMRQVRMDNQDFIVAEMASNIIGARGFGLTAKAQQAAQARTNCRVTGNVYNYRRSTASGMVFPLAC